MIVSFVNLDDRPSSLLAPNLCWDKYTMTSMARRLATSGTNIAVSLQNNKSEYTFHHVIILVDFACPGVDTFLKQASDRGFFKSPYRWLLLNLNHDEESILDELEFVVDSDVVIARKFGEQIVLTEAYKVSKNTEIIYTTRAKWYPSNTNKHLLEDSEGIIKKSTNDSDTTENSDFIKMIPNAMTLSKFGVIEDYRRSKVLSYRRKDLRKHTLTMVNVITDTNETRKHMDDRLFLHQDGIAKMSYGVVKICFEMLNASERLLFTHTWGYRDKYGNWQGVIQHLLDKKADLGTLAIFTLQRMEVIDYVAMVGRTTVRFIFREPPLAYISNIFTLPFSTDVWLAIVVCVLGCAVFLYFTSRWEATVSMNQFQLDGSSADVLILIIGAVLQQGCTLEPRYAAGRTVTLLLFIALTILYAAYSANIVVLLRAPSSSVRTLPDLLNSPIKLGASDFEYNRYFFKQLNDPIRKAIYDKKIAPQGKKPNFYNMKEGVEKIRKGLFAFHMESNPGYRLIQETYHEDEKCDLVEIDYINEIEPWVPGQKRSPFRDLFKINFIKIRESGIQANIHQRLNVPRPKCSGAVAAFSSVGIADMYPALLATLYGVLLAPAVLILEITYHRLMVIRKKRQVVVYENYYTRVILVLDNLNSACSPTLQAQLLKVYETCVPTVLFCTYVHLQSKIIMKLLPILLSLNILVLLVNSKDENTIQFVRRYIENENKPTELVCYISCWDYSIQKKLMIELFTIGVRLSALLRLPSKYFYHDLLFLVDLRCHGSEQVLLNATLHKLFVWPFRWLIIADPVTSQSMIWELPAMPDSDVVLAENRGEGFTLTELHKPAANYSMISTPKGFYNGTFVDVRPYRQMFRRRRDLMGHALTISNVIQDSNTTKYHMLQENRLELQYDAVAKICFISARHAFEMLNVTTRYIFSYRFGYKVNGKWTGMIHDLQENKADLGTNCVVFLNRLEVAVYTDTVAPMRMRFVFRQPPLSYVSNIFALPFSTNVWLAIIICSLACTATLYCTSNWEVQIERASTQLNGSVGDALLLTLSAITQQGCAIEPRRAPGRIMEWVFFAAVMALYAAYSANIVVLLQAPSNSIKTLAQLANSKLELGANDLDYNRFVLSPNETYQDHIHQSIHDRVNPDGGEGRFFHIYEGVEKIRKGLFAFHSIVEPVYHRVQDTFLETEKCDLTEVDYIGSFDASTPVRKDSPYLELLKVVYKQMRETGILSAQNRRLQTPKPHCSNKKAAFASVGVMDLRPVLLLMIYGALLSIVIMLMEIIVFKLSILYREKKKLWMLRGSKFEFLN
ncbi:uncharacterized protein LOC128677894 [Plodia interpunctella]|uniref:uncharacterized protein LOC128677894 n=1 Tax=Plodia interpunctella TaxID=58824 RepID=UPI002367CB15|nr:uncharacterized protein LOC128677894 [Plodia interpunctella]